jgi:hypothetical protein
VLGNLAVVSPELNSSGLFWDEKQRQVVALQATVDFGNGPGKATANVTARYTPVVRGVFAFKGEELL